jgi:PAS domain S-box-containing protein
MASRGNARFDEEDFLQSVDDLFFSDFFPNSDQASSFVTRFNALVPLAAEDPNAIYSILPPSYSGPSSSSASQQPPQGKATNGSKEDGHEPKKQKTTRKTPEERAQHRRELNKKNAARSRLRKKFKIESVIVRAAQLEQENALLKSALKQHGIDVPLGVAPPGTRPKDDELEKLMAKDSLPADYAMLNAIQMSAANFILTDATKTDFPIVFASPGFLEMTGYTRSEVMGRNCRFLQGEHTDHETVGQIRKSLSEGQDIGVTILNYKKDGTPFWNQLFIAPLADSSNQIKYHVGVQRNLQVTSITADIDDSSD